MPEFFEVEGKIPVALGVRRSEVPDAFLPSSWNSMDFCMAWDSDPPRPFDHTAARRRGESVDPTVFWRKVAEVRGDGRDQRAMTA
jgi:hypothetical protein